MKKYQEMNPVQRKIMILKAVASNVSFEGHHEVAKRFIEESKGLEEKIKHTIKKSIHQKS